jgi:hypothetical protein
MNFFKNFVLVALFFMLSPNVLFRLPGNKYVSAFLHGVLFAIVWYVSLQLHPVLEGIDAKTHRKQQAANKNIAGLTNDQAKVVQGRAQDTQVQIQKK